MNEINLFKFVKNQEWDKFIENLNKDIDLNIQDEHSNYLIQYIILYNNIPALQAIIKFDVFIDWLDIEGRSILFLPIKYGYIEVIKILLEYDEKNIGIFLLNIKDTKELLPIHYALMFKNLTIYKLLIKNTKISIFDKNNNSLLHLVPKTKKIDFLIPLFTKNINLDFVNNTHESALHISCEYDLEDFVTVLVDKKCDVNIREKEYGFPAIFISLLNGNTNIVNTILDSLHYDINLSDHTGNTLLHLAIVENNFEIIERCIKDPKLDYNIVNLDGNTYLHLLMEKIKENSENIDKYDIRKFIEYSILNVQNNDGNTAWHYMVSLNIFDKYSELLVNKPNNLFINNKKDVTPFSLVHSINKPKLIDIVSQSYFNLLKTATWNSEWENNCVNVVNPKKCMDKIKELINSGQSSVPIKKTSYCMNIEDPKFVSFTTFTGINFDVITSYIELIKKYPSLTTSITENFVKNGEVEKYYNKLGITKDLDNEYLNFEIFWIFQQIIFPLNFEHTISAFIKSDKVIMAVPIAIELDLGAHANLLIIDKRFKVIERFEPNGKNEPIHYSYNGKLLDNLLKMYFTKILSLKSYTFLSPNAIQPTIGFQSLEVHENDKMKKIGDPGGFCVAWCLWYLEQRIKYNVNPIKLPLKLIIKIRSNNISFKKLIRMYANNILKTRNSILDQMELDINEIRNNNITEKQKSELQQLIKYELLNV